MNIVLINQNFVSPHEPGHTRHYELGCYLQHEGHQLIIVASNLNYQTGARTTDKRGLIVEQTIDGVRILRTYILPALHRSFVWRVIAFFSFMFTSVWAALRAGQVDVVMGTTPPIFQAVSAWVVATLRRRPFLLEVRDLWPEFAIDMGVLKNPALITLSRWLERFLYARATHIVVNSPAYQEYLRDKQVPESKISFIPYGADLTMFHPDVDGERLKHELGLENRFIITYAGALGLANDIQTLLVAAFQLRNEVDIQFVLFGDGRERDRLQAFVAEHNLTNVTFAGTLPKHRMPEALAASDVCVAILQDIPMFRTTYPNKVFDYMAAGHPSVVAIDGVIRQVIEEADGGICVPPGNPTVLADALRQLFQDRALGERMGQNARAYVEKHFDRKKRMAEFTSLLAELHQNGRRGK